VSVVVIGVATVNSVVINYYEGRKGVMIAMSAVEQFKLKYFYPINFNVIRFNHSGIESGSYTPDCSRFFFLYLPSQIRAYSFISFSRYVNGISITFSIR